MASQNCKQCGHKLDSRGRFCAQCGTQVKEGDTYDLPNSPKSAIVALLLCLFLGPFGAHRFYVGKIGTGILMLLTAGGFGIWTLIDLVFIACCEFKDKEGRTLVFTRGRGSPLKLALTILGVVIACIIIYVIFLVTLVLYLTTGITDSVRNQLTAIREGDLQKAYFYTAEDFRKNTSFDDFKNFINHFPALANNKKISINEREIKNNQGTVRGKVEDTDGNQSTIEYRLIKENNIWKILGIHITTDAGIQPPRSAAPASIEMKTYKDKVFKYSMQYPVNWDYEKRSVNSAMFNGKKGTSSYYNAVIIQVVPTKNLKLKGITPLYTNVNDLIAALKQQIKAQAQDITYLNEGNAELPQNPKKYTGRFFIVTYSYKGRVIKKMQFILGEKNGKWIYSWGYTAPIELYPEDLNKAKAMFESWKIQ